MTPADRSRQPLSDLRFSLVGPGRVGASLASWAVARGAELAAVAGRRPDAGGPLARRLGGRAVDIDELAGEDEDLLLVTVSDAALPAVAERLADRPQARVALHASGRLGAEALAALADRSAVGALHPLLAFPRPLPDPARARGVFFALDGDRPARRLGARLASAWGGTSARVAAAARPAYHLAATLAAGGVATLLATAAEVAAGGGVPRRAVAGYLALARATLDRAAEEDDPAAAITGPVARGEAQALEAQVATLLELVPDAAPLLLAVARESLRQAARLEEPGADRQALADRLERSGLTARQIRAFLDPTERRC